VGAARREPGAVARRPLGDSLRARSVEVLCTVKGTGLGRGVGVGVAVGRDVDVGLDASIGVGTSVGRDLAARLDVAATFDVIVRGHGGVVGWRPVVVVIAVAAPVTTRDVIRSLPRGVAREHGAAQPAQNVPGLQTRQPLGMIGQQPAERRRPEVGEERFDRTEWHVDHRYHQEQRLPRGRNRRRPRVGLVRIGCAIRCGGQRYRRRRIGAEQDH
jgi:hypothetical protein